MSKRVLTWALATCFLCATVCRSETADPTSRVAAPSAADISKAEATIKDVYKSEFTQRDIAHRDALAIKLLRDSAEGGNDSATRYVLLRDASDKALEAGDAPTALAATEAITAGFAVNVPEIRRNFLTKASKIITDPKGAASLTEAGLKWIDQAVASEEYDEAIAKLGPAVEAMASRTRDNTVITRCRARLKAVRATQEEAVHAKSALRTLQENVDDPQANLVAGKFECFSKSDFATGLPMLVKGADPVLASLASHDQLGADTLDLKLKLGDSWAEFGAKHHDISRGCLIRAQYWYLLAMKDATGIARIKVLKKLRILPPGADFDLLKDGWSNTETSEVSGGFNENGSILPAEPGLLIGFEYHIIGWLNRTIIQSMAPVFITAGGRTIGDFRGQKLKEGTGQFIEAPPGYAVGGIAVDAKDRVFGIKLRFMRIHGSVLDPDDAYDSPWVGEHSDPKIQVFGGDGRPIVGVHFRSGADVEGIGIVQLK